MSDYENNERPPSAEVEAVIEQKKKKRSPLVEKIVAAFSLIFFTTLATFSPIVVRIAHKESEKFGYTFIGSTTVFGTEIFKLIFCFIIIPIKHRSLKTLFVQLVESFTVNKIETLKICVPSLCYVVRNYFFFFALQRIDAMLFSLTFQLRILATVILMMIVLKRRFTVFQWLSLFILLIGVVTVQLGEQLDHSDHHSEHTLNSSMKDKIFGVVAVLAMCLCTGFGSVYMEAVMKQSDADIFLQNARLGLMSLPLSVVAMFSDYEKITHHGFFYGYNVYVWIVVVLNAVGGLVVSAVLLHTDNVKKSFCQALALGGTMMLSIAIGDSTFSLYLLAGVLLVITSVILYALATRWQKDNAKFQALTESIPEELAVLQEGTNPQV